MDYPSKRPYLNPINHICGKSGKIIKTMIVTNKRDLAKILNRKNKFVSLQKILDAMNRQITAVIQAKGSFTKYF